MKKIALILKGTSITLTFVAPGIYTFTNSGILYYVYQQAAPNMGQDDYAGWNILNTYNNTVSIQQFANNATAFAAGQGALANYRELTNAVNAFNAGQVTFGTVIPALLH